MLKPSVVDVRFLWSTLTYEMCNRVVEVAVFRHIFFGKSWVTGSYPIWHIWQHFSDRKHWTWFRWVGKREEQSQIYKILWWYGTPVGPHGDPIGTSKSLVSTTKFLPSMAPRRHLRGNDGDAEFLQDRASWIWWNRHRSTGWEVTARNPAWINFDGPTNMKIACKSQHFGYLTQALFLSAGAHDILRFLADLIFTCCRVYKSTVSVEQIEKSQKNPMFRWHSMTFSFLVHPSCSGQPRSTSPGCAMTDVIRKVPAPMA